MTASDPLGTYIQGKTTSPGGVCEFVTPEYNQGTGWQRTGSDKFTDTTGGGGFSLNEGS